jgi:hypothetical protein
MRADQAFQAALLRLLRPLVRIALRQGVAHAAFDEMVKQAYVQAASQDAEFNLPGRKQTASRVSVLTGLTRKEVARLQSSSVIENGEATSSRNRAVRVLNGWVSRYKTPDGNLADINDDDFSMLVRNFSGDIPVRAVLDELIRIGAVSRNENGLLKLHMQQYVPQADGTNETKLTLMGEHVSDLIASIDHNLTNPPERAFFQRRMFADNLPAASSAVVRMELERQSKVLLELARQTLNEHDQGESTTAVGQTRATLGVYYYEEQISSPDVQLTRSQRKRP